MIEKVKIVNTEILSDNWYTLRKVTYEYLKKEVRSRFKVEKHTIEEMEQQFYYITLI